MKQNKFLFGQTAWFMESNKPTSGTIFIIEYIEKTETYKYTMYIGGQRLEKDIFETKELLKESLFN